MCSQRTLDKGENLDTRHESVTQSRQTKNKNSNKLHVSISLARGIINSNFLIIINSSTKCKKKKKNLASFFFFSPVFCDSSKNLFSFYASMMRFLSQYM